MHYFVTGATGLIGTHLIERLLEDGHEVTALTRSRSNAAHLPAAVRVVEGDVTEKGSMRAPMTDVDGVFHLAGWYYLGAGDDDRAEQVNVEGTRNVLELMAELDVPKGVYTSTIGVHPGTARGPIDETTVPDCPEFATYFRTKWRAHYEVARPMMDDGLPLVVVQPGAVFGRGDKPRGSVRAGFRDYLTGNLPAVPRNWSIPFDYAPDTARAHVQAMERGRPGEEYIVASQPRTLTEVFDCAESITGVPAPPAVPDALFGGLASVMDVARRFVTPPDALHPELLRFQAGRQYRVDTAKARRELGVEHRPLAAGLQEYLAWELDELGSAAVASTEAVDAGLSIGKRI